MKKDINNSLTNFMIFLSIILLISFLCVKRLIFDLNKLFSSVERKDNFISNLIETFKK